MIEKLKSRKLWTMVLTATLVALCKGLDLPLSEVELAALVAPAVAYIFAQGKVDAEEKRGVRVRAMIDNAESIKPLP